MSQFTRNFFHQYKGVSGVYKITNLLTKEFYIGASNNCGRRWCQHIAATSLPVQKDIQGLGVENFIFQVIERVEPERLPERETYWIKTLHPTYNTLQGSNGRPGKSFHQSEEARSNISKALKGKPKSPKARFNMLGPRTPAGRAKIAEAHSREEYRKKVSAQVSRDKRDTVWIHLEGVGNKRIKKEYLEEYLSNNWQLGQMRKNT